MAKNLLPREHQAYKDQMKTGGVGDTRFVHRRTIGLMDVQMDGQMDGWMVAVLCPFFDSIRTMGR